jgi:hypothetical protein
MSVNRSSWCLPTLALAALPAVLASGAAQATVAWDEAVNGDLSGAGLTPSFVAFVAGGNQLLGTTGRSVAGGPIDLDYLHFSVPAGHVLQSLWVLPGTTTIGGGSFVGLQAGPQLTLPPSTFSAAGLLGWTLFGPDEIGNDLFDIMSVPANDSSGFAVPLPAGDYSLWVQETGVGSVSYGLEFVVVEVPEAASALAMLGGLALLAGVLRRR